MGFGPVRELSFNRVDDAIKKAEVAVVQAEPAGEFPDSLDGVQFRAIGRQEVQGELCGLLKLPRQV